METLEEVAKKYATNHGMMSYVFPEKEKSFIDGAKWQQERSYSEEDMKEAFRIGFNVGYNDEESPSYLIFEEWFKNGLKKFKNK
jgi:hypothetical protein